MSNVRVERDGDVAVLLLHTAGPVNTLNGDVVRDLSSAVEQALHDDSVRGIVLTSGRPGDFLAGADLTLVGELRGFDGDRADLLRQWRALSVLLRRLETGGKPVAAAINGSALGGGLELALACHRRFVSDEQSIALGLPETQLGMIPAAGGTQRLPRLLGLLPAVLLMANGTRLSPGEALTRGLADETAPADELLARAVDWASRTNAAEAVQPWDRPGFTIPGGEVQSRSGIANFLGGNAMLHARAGDHAPQVRALLEAVYTGCSTTIDAGLLVESKVHLALLLSPVPQNMVRTLFFDAGALRKMPSRPSAPGRPFRRLGIVGAGLMGEGIAGVALRRGLGVVVVDSDGSALDRMSTRLADRLDRQVSRGRLTGEERDATLGRLEAGTQLEALAGSDAVLEAVSEDRAVKQQVLSAARAVCPEALLASNTSTLPISGLAQGLSGADRFCGLHFVSPVDRMPLVEVIAGAGTSQETVAQAMDIVAALGKTPLQVADSRGFYGTRIFSALIAEAIAMLREGVPAAAVERCAGTAGFGMGPLRVADTIGLPLLKAATDAARADLRTAYAERPADAVVDRMVELGRLGTRWGGGFYDGARLWPGLAAQWPVADEPPDPAHISLRLLHAMALEGVRCVEEGVVTDPAAADVGSVFVGLFPAHTGGVLSYIDTVGSDRFVEDLDRLAAAVPGGERFAPTPGLRAHAAAGGHYRP